MKLANGELFVIYLQAHVKSKIEGTKVPMESILGKWLDMSVTNNHHSLIVMD